ncbi:MAG: SusD/RagB family nutrient-binding outer membrane lipoprotein [Cyclobacteriaceae bacterium]|nr:SusD/RagB family nutrient-binding outer membrane lipoprotein [Cyclobacteriaceae bacterium]
MNLIKYRFKKIAAVLSVLFVVTSCDIFDLDINTDPNNPTEVTPDLLLPSVMYNASASFAGGVNSNTHGFVGAIASADAFDLSVTSYTGLWQNLYTGPLKDLDEVIKFTTNAGNLPGYLGIAQVLKAYYGSMLVDLWGDVPYFTAWNGNNLAEPNANPAYDGGSAIYDDCLALIDAAIVNLSATDPTNLASGDAIYGGSRTNWIKAANSLKLRLLIQTRLVRDNKAAIAAVLGQPLINTTSEDWQFQFGKTLNPDNRHPWYQAAYTGAENGYSYLSHQMMYEMFRDGDPRFPFYFKRQTTKILNFDDPTERSTAPCTQTVGCKYGYLVLNTGTFNTRAELQAAGRISNPPTAADNAYLAGIFGRDRGDRAGVPLDGSLRTAPGVYPAGGYYDDGGFNSGGAGLRKVGSNNAFGNGIFPMITSSMVKFYRAEAILTGQVAGTADNAKVLFEAALREHIAKVVAFGRAVDAASVTPSSASVESYVSLWLAKWDAAPSNDAKLNVLLKQAWFSNLGNGHEIYNAFRRTGLPNDIMAPLQRVRQFALRLPYSLDDLTLNQSVTDKERSTVFDQNEVFWDVLKFKF